MTPQPTRTALIVDEHPLWLDALQTLLERVDIKVIGRAAGRSDAIGLLEEHPPDLFVADLDAISDGTADPPNTCSALVRAHEINPSIKCVVLSDRDDPADLDRAFNSGASVFCVKRADPEDLAVAIRQSFNSAIYFRPPPRNATHVPESPVAVPRESVGLTKREVEILRLAAEGHSNSQLAKMLWVTEQTVKFHLSNIYRKLDVTNRTEASRWAGRNGLLTEQNSRTLDLQMSEPPMDPASRTSAAPTTWGPRRVELTVDERPADAAA